MAYNYCTLFDSFFLSRGLALYDSLKETTPDFKLFLFPFDNRSLEVLRSLNLPNVTIIEQQEFETPQLLTIKGERTRGEYCWTCTSVIIEYCLEKFNLPQCTYLDADLYFFENANALVEEMGTQSVLITDHRYSTRYDQSAGSGKYCVQFMTFKNDTAGRTALTWWKERCLEWCYDRIENEKFGDQKYLDDWLVRFKGIHELQNEGGGLAPWNIQQYKVGRSGDHFFAKNQKTGREWLVVFYHFHALKFLQDGRIDLGAYQLPKDSINSIYRVYLVKLIEWNELLNEKFKLPFPEVAYRPKKGTPVLIHKLVRKVMGVYNVFNKNEFKAHGTSH